MFGTHISRERFERMIHVKTMEVNDTSGHRVVAQVHLRTSVDDEPCPFLTVPGLPLMWYAILSRGGPMQLILVEIPKGHCRSIERFCRT